MSGWPHVHTLPAPQDEPSAIFRQPETIDPRQPRRWQKPKAACIGSSLLHDPIELGIVATHEMDTKDKRVAKMDFSPCARCSPTRPITPLCSSAESRYLDGAAVSLIRSLFGYEFFLKLPQGLPPPPKRRGTTSVVSHGHQPPNTGG
jgi:hypothetical protein